MKEFRSVVNTILFGALAIFCLIAETRGDNLTAGLKKYVMVGTTSGGDSLAGGEPPISNSSLEITGAKLKRVGMFSPFGLTPGGGERYFLAAAVAFKEMGYSVDLLLYDDASCVQTTCIAKTLKSLRIPMDVSDFNVTLVPNDNSLHARLTAGDLPGKKRYEVFFMMGIWKIPWVVGVGELNLFMCQFPFDMYGEKKQRKVYMIDAKLKIFQTYDRVLVNSKFTMDWWVKVTQVELSRGINKDIFIPSLSILYPPVEPYKTTVSPLDTAMPRTTSLIHMAGVSQSEQQQQQQQQRVFNIAVCGRFFAGRQSKGHNHALKILKNIREQTQAPVHLYLIGFVYPGDPYVDDLKANATKLGVSDAVTFMANAPSSEVEKTLLTTTVLWHLTGAELLGERDADPASFEHFGIAIVEAMSIGCIPIVTNLGGTTDIVQDGYNGYLAGSLNDYSVRTLQLISSPHQAVLRLRENAKKSAQRFSTLAFTLRLRGIVLDGISTMGLRALKRDKSRMDELRQQQQQPHPYKLQTTKNVKKGELKKSVALVISSINYMLELSVRSLLSHLSPGWSLLVFHPEELTSFAHVTLKSVPGVMFVRTPRGAVQTAADYDMLLTSKWFWNNFQREEKVLLFDLDTLILRKGLEHYLSFDYVSSPPYERTPRLGENIILFGQGGFSLRTAGAMQSVLEMYSFDKTFDSEHQFFTTRLEDLRFLIANATVARSFSCEVDCERYFTSYLSRPHGSSSSSEIQGSGTMANNMQGGSAAKISVLEIGSGSSSSIGSSSGSSVWDRVQMPLAIHGGRSTMNQTTVDKLIDLFIFPSPRSKALAEV